MNNNIYDFTVKDKSGNDVSLNKYKGKVLLIVNTASKCGFTPQYEGLQNLYDKYKDKGLMILAFPCDQFAHQEPGSDEEIQQFCSVNYGVTFPVMKKIKVNGKEADPLYIMLKKALPDGLFKSIKWNFTKFLIDRKGNPVKRFASPLTPEKIEPEIQSLL